MSTPTWRDLSTPEQRQSLVNLYQSMFFSELLAPSKPLWLFSGWISDIAIVDNSARQFQALCPFWEARKIRLSECIDALCKRGGKVVLVLRKDKKNTKFITTIKKTNSWHAGKIGMTETDLQHAKVMVGEHFMIDGSMNYTYYGIELNSEKVTYRCDESALQEELLKLEGEWENSILWGPHE